MSRIARSRSDASAFFSSSGGSFSIVEVRRRAHAVDFKLLAVPGACFVEPKVLADILASHPTLAEHACDVDGATTFGSVADAGPVETGHLLEHLAIDLLVHAYAEAAEDGCTPTIAGHTSWISREQGIQRITISYVAGDVAMLYESMRQACGILDAVARRYATVRKRI